MATSPRSRRTAYYNLVVETPISFRTDEAKRDEIDKVAQSLDRDRSWIINQALDQFLEQHRWHADQINKGLRDIEEGRYKSLDAVRSKFQRKAVKSTQTTR